jgi:hypothetical protein
MLYDAKGNLIGEGKREYRCRTPVGDYSYLLLPKGSKSSAYAILNPRYEHAPYENDMITEDVPEKLRPVFVVYKRLRRLGVSPDKAFRYEIETAKEHGVLEDYMKLVCSEEAFEEIRKSKDCGSELLDIKFEPKTRLKDMEKYLEERAGINMLFESGAITEKGYSRRVNKLERRYSGKIFTGDRLLFSDGMKFRKFLDFVKSRRPDASKWADKTYEHEKEHFDAIKDDPGLRTAGYAMWILAHGKEEALMPAVETVGKTNGDYIRIRRKSIEAAREKSPGDKFEIGENSKGYFSE